MLLTAELGKHQLSCPYFPEVKHAPNLKLGKSKIFSRAGWPFKHLPNISHSLKDTHNRITLVLQWSLLLCSTFSGMQARANGKEDLERQCSKLNLLLLNFLFHIQSTGNENLRVMKSCKSGNVRDSQMLADSTPNFQLGGNRTQLLEGSIDLEDCLSIVRKEQQRWSGMQGGGLASSKLSFICGLITPFVHKLETPWRPQTHIWEFGATDTCTELCWGFFRPCHGSVPSN